MSSHVSFIYKLNIELLLYTLMWITPLVAFQVNINFTITSDSLVTGRRIYFDE